MQVESGRLVKGLFREAFLVRYCMLPLMEALSFRRIFLPHAALAATAGRVGSEAQLSRSEVEFTESEVVLVCPKAMERAFKKRTLAGSSQS